VIESLIGVYGIDITNLDLDIALHRKVCIRAIYALDSKITDCQVTPQDLNTFINPNESFALGNLITAFNFIIKFHIKNIKKMGLSMNIPLSEQTNLHPVSYSPRILYAICQYYGITTDFNMTLTDMRSSILIKLNSTMISMLNPFLSALSTEDQLIYNLYRLTSQEYETLPINQESLLQEYNNILTSSMMHYRVSNLTFIVVGLLYYKIDLTSVICPNKILISYITSTLPKEDLGMIQNFTFNPLIPEKLYDKEILAALVKRESFSKVKMDSYSDYELLQLSCIKPTFYSGNLNPNQERSIIEYSPISEYDPNILVSYGVKENNTFDVYSIEELINLFNNYKSFANGLPGAKKRIFKTRSIRKLELISEELSLHNQTNQYQYQLLIKTIKDIRKFAASLRGKVHFLKHIDNFDKCKYILNQMFEIGMYIRGWTGKGKYPLESIVTNKNVVMTVVSPIIVSLLNFIKNGDYDYLMSLPLIVLVEKKFVVNTDIDQGSNIGEKLRMVTKGDDTTNINSCLRTSSNYLIATGYYYLSLLDSKIVYDISTMTYIK
jgi:hypothetical protein